MNNSLTDADIQICRKCGNVFFTKTLTICPQCKEPLT